MYHTLSVALMLCGSVTFFNGFLLLPLVLALIVVLYVAGIVSAISMAGRSILSFILTPPPCSSRKEISVDKNVDGGKGKEPIVVRSNTSSRKRVGAGAKNLGRLDLNVELSNEVEEAVVAGGRRESNREVDNIIEGIEFFEGLDEFLSSLQILSIVGDDKIKAT
ncbi:hypothetical protein Bca52824_027002 [Brassica carinata]|uniref:Uncharacterized protein n=1 Tax=Brassica carinata TaxID=52824 RepID=A0A8X7SLE9_BRACI|nr:hypothetical protein Bca52824_027002 [Brassica carinata]